jgi:hypothetical protein
MKAPIDTGSYQYGNPTAAEQAHLESINRARLNPAAEAARLLGGNLNEGLSAGQISTAPKQPLTFNALLYSAAKAHSQDMIARNYIDHYSPAPVTNPSDRIIAAGYTSFNYIAENIAAKFSTGPLNEISTIVEMHDGLVQDFDVPGRGHRINIFSESAKEIGIGTASGSISYGGKAWPYAWLLTCDFAARPGNAFVLGVVYNDSNMNGQYNAGEGMGGVAVSVVRSPDGGTASTITASAGGYGIPLPPGTYTITARLADGRELEYPLTMSDRNIKIDFKKADFSGSPEPDTTPDPFSFTDLTNAQLNTVVTSNAITVSGINTATNISISGGTYSVNGGPYTSAPGTVSNGSTVRVQLTSSGSYSTTTSATLTIGGVSDTFSVTTRSESATPDTTPDPFSFTDLINAQLNTVVTSNAITVSGINTATNISISGGTYSVNGGPYTSAPGTINNGNTVRVQLTSSGSYSTTTSATLTIGGVSDTFSVTTRSESATPDTTPDPFSFTDLTNAQLNTVVTSNAITVSGINTATNISISGGTYSVNGGPYTSAPGTVSNGSTVRVQLTSSGSYSTTTSATLTIGGVSDTFSVTTRSESATPDTTPDPFTFDEETGAPLDTVITSNTITVSGINAPADISIIGGTYSINGWIYTDQNGTVNNGDTVTVQITSADTHSTTTDATLTIGDGSATFSVTTRGKSSGGGGGDDGGGGCFVATAAFGSPMAAQVDILRQFRDRYLLTNVWGREFVAWYYQNGPAAAHWIQDRPLVKMAVRTALYPLIGISILLISGYLPWTIAGLILSGFVYVRFGPRRRKTLK